MTYPEANSNVPEGPENTDFLTQIAPLLPSLLYPSESDEPIEPVETYLNGADPLTVSHIKDWLMLPPSVYVEEIPEADFWSSVVTIEEWFGEEERTQTEQFQQLQSVVEATLTERQVFRIGDVEIDVYLLGKPAEGSRVGLKTRVVET
jgi:hypothetical protein